MSVRSGSVALLVVLAGAISSAAPAQPRDEYVVAFGPGAPDCPAGRHPRVTVAQISADPKAHVGRCVRVRGVWARRELYADISAYHRLAGGRGAAAAGPDALQIGVYAPDDLINRKGANYDTPVSADMIARVGDCDDLAKAADFVVGYCHTDRGPYLSIQDADLAPLRLVRLVSDKDRFEVGDLAIAPKDWPGRAVVEGLVEEWTRAFAARDEKALIGLYGLDDSQLHWARSSQETPGVSPPAPAYADFLAYRPGRQVEVFVEKPQGAAGPRGAEGAGGWGAIGCVCREADCTGRWPIRWMDARNSPARPYVCLDAAGPAGRPGEDLRRWRARAGLDERRMAEPAR